MANRPSLNKLRDHVAKAAKRLRAAEQAVRELTPPPPGAPLTQVMDYDEVLDIRDAAQAAHERAQEAVRRRIEQSRQADERRKANRTLAEQAGVPPGFLDQIVVHTNRNDVCNIYFGGAGKPDGPGRGHFAVDSAGEVFLRIYPAEQLCT